MYEVKNNFYKEIDMMWNSGVLATMQLRISFVFAPSIWERKE
jgi:hypothetical protein